MSHTRIRSTPAHLKCNHCEHINGGCATHPSYMPSTCPRAHSNITHFAASSRSRHIIFVSVPGWTRPHTETTNASHLAVGPSLIAFLGHAHCKSHIFHSNRHNITTTSHRVDTTHQECCLHVTNMPHVDLGRQRRAIHLSARPKTWQYLRQLDVLTSVFKQVFPAFLYGPFIVFCRFSSEIIAFHRK